MHLGDVLIRPASHRKVWWSCDQCPDGLPHIWESTVENRMYGRGCPFCSGRAVCQHNTLAGQAPEVALFWDAKKNRPMSPTHVTLSSGMRAHWKCIVCSCEWQASVVDKVRGKTGCPKCAKANGGRKADGTRQKHPTFIASAFGLKQKEDEHSLRMDRERAELEDRSAKRRRFDASTDDGITFRSLLAKAAEGVSDAKGIEEKARQIEPRTGSVQGFQRTDYGQSQASALQHRCSGCYS
ncbi:TPA: hypothetical protein ACH3X1_005216 [Trebouxia sp. C0004]